MAGNKRKPIGQAEKAQAGSGKKQESKGGKDGKSGKFGGRSIPGVLRVDEAEAVKLLTPLKAITIHGAARALGTDGSTAGGLLKNLENKSVLRRVGGYSGHFVYALANS